MNHIKFLLKKDVNHFQAGNFNHSFVSCFDILNKSNRSQLNTSVSSIVSEGSNF